MTISSSIVRPPWPCPECRHHNVWTTARCVNRRYDSTSPRYQAVPPVPHNVSIQDFGDYMQSLGLVGVPPPAVEWRCEYVHPCLKPGCETPGRAYSHGIRCDEHRDLASFAEEAV